MALVLCVLLAGCGGPGAEIVESSSPTGESPTGTATGTPTSIETPTAPSASPTGPATPIHSDREASILASGRTAVSLVDANGTQLAVVNASVADSPRERYRGLSNTTSLPNGTGMLFVYGEADQRAYVMREMAFPLDMVFVAANRTITAIHHAPVENDSDLTRYPGLARWVLEVPYGWTRAEGVDVGDRIEITSPSNTTVTDKS